MDRSMTEAWVSGYIHLDDVGPTLTTVWAWMEGGRQRSSTPLKRSRGIPEGRATCTIASDLELRIWTRVKGGTVATRGRRQQNKDMRSKEHQCDALVLFRHQVTPPSPHRQDTQPPLLSRVSASPPLPSSTVLFLRIENSNSHQAF